MPAISNSLPSRLHSSVRQRAPIGIRHACKWVTDAIVGLVDAISRSPASIIFVLPTVPSSTHQQPSGHPNGTAMCCRRRGRRRRDSERSPTAFESRPRFGWKNGRGSDHPTIRSRSAWRLAWSLISSETVGLSTAANDITAKTPACRTRRRLSSLS